MADRIADNADLAIDEVKRRARRRLVGAIVLALAAAIVLPLLLEREPRPLGDDVSVQIPPVDEGKFVNRLTGKSADTKPLPKAEGKSDAKAGGTKGDAKPEPAADAKTEPRTEPRAEAATATKGSAGEQGAAAASGKALAEAEQRVLSPAPKAPAKAETKTEARADAKGAAPSKPAPKVAPAETKAAPKVAAADAKSEPKAPAAPPKAEPKEAPEPAPSRPPGEPPPTDAKAAAPASAKADGFVVQLAAFADDKGANALVNKLVKGGYSAYVEPVQTSRGTLWRVRVGGYASRTDADAARAKLKVEGYSGIVAPAK